VIYSQDRTWVGKTTDISETGARIILNSWPDLPDEVELELVGDFGARAFLNARIVRSVAMNESQTVLAVDFIDPSTTQLDALALVIYSDVKEWYSQNREEMDDPLGSLKFLATGLVRAFRDAQPEKAMKVRKHIRTFVRLYWDGNFYVGQAVEMGFRSLRLELDGSSIPNIETLQRTKPPVGLLFDQEEAATEPLPPRLLGLVQAVEVIPADASGSSNNRIAVELSFPEQLKYRQEAKIKQLLKTLPTTSV
jgi:cellulose synthase (UDP-forming)